MALLLLLTSVLLGLSGLLKLRSGSRSGGGVGPLTVVELALALITAGAVVAGHATTRSVGWLVPAGVLLVIGSSAAHVKRMAVMRRDREEQIGARLYAFLKYSSPGKRPDEDRP